MSKPLAGKIHLFLGKLYGYYWMSVTQCFYRPAFGAIGLRTRIINPLKMRNMENIFIGSNVVIANQAWLFTVPALENHTPKLEIGNGCQIGNYNHITCVNSVRIGAKVLTADRVHISDNSHDFTDPNSAILDQPVISKGPVEIGEGTWIGENVNVLSSKIGRNCVVGANAVVINDLPDYCVAVGAPARVVRRFDLTRKAWIRESHSNQARRQKSR